MPNEREEGRQEAKERVLAYLKQKLEEWDHLDNVALMVASLIEDIEGWYK